MVLILIEKMLEIALRLQKSSNIVLRLAGRSIGFFPVRLAEWMEKKYLDSDKEKKEK